MSAARLLLILKERRVGDSVGCVVSSLVRERRGCLVEDTVSVVVTVSVSVVVIVSVVVSV